MSDRERHLPQLPSRFPTPIGRRAVVVGAGSFGTAVAVLLARGGLRTTLQARTPEQAERLQTDRENAAYLPGVEFPQELRIEPVGAGLARAEIVFSVSRRAACTMWSAPAGRRSVAEARIVSLAKGLVPPDGIAPDRVLSQRRSAPTAWRASAGRRTRARWSTRAPGWSPRPRTRSSRTRSAAVFIRAGVVCESSNDPVGVELAGAAKNAAALAAGATEGQGLNAAGAAAGHIFAEVWRFAEPQGARPSR